MLLKRSTLLILFFTFICLSCNNHDTNKINIKIKNNTNNTIMFDNPNVIFLAIEFQNTEKNYMNLNINIIRRVEQLNAETGVITIPYSIPWVEMITLEPGEIYKTSVLNNKLDTSKENEYIFFILTECVLHNDYNYYDYIDDMKKSGFFINKKIKGKNITLNIKETELKKMTALAEENFPSLYDSYNGGEKY